MSAPAQGIARLWLHNKELIPASNVKAYERQPWSVTPGKTITVAIEISNLKGKAGWALMSSHNKPYGEKGILSNGTHTITLMIPQGVTGITPMIYSVNNASSFDLKINKIEIK